MLAIYRQGPGACTAEACEPRCSPDRPVCRGPADSLTLPSEPWLQAGQGAGPGRGPLSPASSPCAQTQAKRTRSRGDLGPAKPGD